MKRTKTSRDVIRSQSFRDPRSTNSPGSSTSESQMPQRPASSNGDDGRGAAQYAGQPSIPGLDPHIQAAAAAAALAGNPFGINFAHIAAAGWPYAGLAPAATTASGHPDMSSLEAAIRARAYLEASARYPGLIPPPTHLPTSTAGLGVASSSSSAGASPYDLLANGLYHGSPFGNASSSTAVTAAAAAVAAAQLSSHTGTHNNNSSSGTSAGAKAPTLQDTQLNFEQLALIRRNSDPSSLLWNLKPLQHQQPHQQREENHHHNTSSPLALNLNVSHKAESHAAQNGTADDDDDDKPLDMSVRSSSNSGNNRNLPLRPSNEPQQPTTTKTNYFRPKAMLSERHYQSKHQKYNNLNHNLNNGGSGGAGPSDSSSIQWEDTARERQPSLPIIPPPSYTSTQSTKQQSNGAAHNQYHRPSVIACAPPSSTNNHQPHVTSVSISPPSTGSGSSSSGCSPSSKDHHSNSKRPNTGSGGSCISSRISSSHHESDSVMGSDSEKSTSTTTITSSMPAGALDPVIDEHFRRSLGHKYTQLFASTSGSGSKEPANGSQDKKEEATNSSKHDSPSSTGPTVSVPSMSVDDHFAMALGDAWAKLKQNTNATNQIDKNAECEQAEDKQTAVSDNDKDEKMEEDNSHEVKAATTGGSGTDSVDGPQDMTKILPADSSEKSADMLDAVENANNDKKTPAEQIEDIKAEDNCVESKTNQQESESNISEKSNQNNGDAAEPEDEEMETDKALSPKPAKHSDDNDIESKSPAENQTDSAPAAAAVTAAES